MYAGVQRVKTDYVALIEDDSLYSMEHFTHRPSSLNAFSYNRSMWFLDGDIFWDRKQIGTFNCIAPTKLLMNTLKKRFEKFPEEPMPRNDQKYAWGEPGKFEHLLGLDNPDVEYFETEIPNLTLVYKEATFGRPKRYRKHPACTELSYWGNAYELNSRLIGPKIANTYIWRSQ